MFALGVTPGNGVLLEKPIVVHLVKKLKAVYGIQRFTRTLP
jgi:hypothetical protein